MTQTAVVDKLTAWTTIRNQENRDSYLEVNGVQTDFSLKFQIGYYDKMDILSSERWNIIDLEKDIFILENRRVNNSAYFVEDLDASHNRIDFSGLDVSRPAADLIKIDYSGNSAGWIVLPMHLNSGWKAFVDGRQVNYNTYLDMLPAIPVQGAGHVSFEYHSESSRTGATMSMAGIFIFLLFSGLCFRKAERPH
jgi:hypothetical protein